MAKPKTYIEASVTGTKGTIRIVDRISEWSQSSSQTIREIVDDYLKNGVTDVEVYINSIGGNCFEATEMCNDLKRLPKVSLIIGSVAASAATYFMTQFPSSAYPNSQFMTHRPKLGTYGDIIGIRADLKLLENTTQIYADAYSAKMNKTAEQIEEMFGKGDYWMTAIEARQEGLLDIILDQPEEVTAESVLLLEAVAAPIIPTNNNNQTLNLMERKLLISTLGLAADASDADITAKLGDLKEQAGKTATLEATAETTLKETAEALVDGAIEAKKITADQKATYVGLATKDFAATKTILEAMHGVTKASENLEETPSAEGREKWTLEDYMEKDPEAIAEMMVKEPAKHAKLEAAYFGTPE